MGRGPSDRCLVRSASGAASPSPALTASYKKNLPLHSPVSTPLPVSRKSPILLSPASPPVAVPHPHPRSRRSPAPAPSRAAASRRPPTPPAQSPLAGPRHHPRSRRSPAPAPTRAVAGPSPHPRSRRSPAPAPHPRSRRSPAPAPTAAGLRPHPASFVASLSTRLRAARASANPLDAAAAAAELKPLLVNPEGSGSGGDEPVVFGLLRGEWDQLVDELQAGLSENVEECVEFAPEGGKVVVRAGPSGSSSGTPGVELHVALGNGNN